MSLCSSHDILYPVKNVPTARKPVFLCDSNERASVT